MKASVEMDDTVKRDLSGRLSFPGLLNARDLGGYATLDGARTRARSLLRTDDLSQLTPEGVQALLSYGVRAVIDLRWPRELKMHPSVFQRGTDGVRYTHVSLLDGSEEAWRSRTPDVPKERWNCVVLDHARKQMADALRAVARAPEGVVLFHCAAGKDRTGVIAAILLAAADVQPADIALDYAISTEYIRDAYLAAHPPGSWEAVLEDVRCPPEQVHNMLAHLEDRYGGTVEYLRLIGLRDTEIASIRDRLTPGAQAPRGS
jgi:protein-tyrosine phosphatase